MAIPVGVETVTVSSGEPLTLPDGTFVRGHIRFVAPPLMVVPSDDYTLGGEAVAELVDGAFSITLVAGDATDINPTGWTYAVYGEFTNAVDWTSEAFLVKANPTVKLADVLQPDASLPNYFTQKLPLAGGTMTGDIVLVGDPTAALHPATKQYTDAKAAAVQAAAAAESVSLAGDTMSGPLVLSGNPVAALGAAPKQYVDAQAAAAQAAAQAASAAESVSLTGDTMTGPLVLPGNPASALQAAPKQYVDAAQAAAAAESVSLAGGDTMTGVTGASDGANISIPNIIELLGALVSTGMIRGGSVDQNISNPIAIDIAPFVGYIVDATANENAPLVRRVQKTVTTTLVCATPSQPIVWYYLNPDGTFGQQTTEPNAQDRVAKLQLGFTLQSGGLIVEAQTTHERITQKTGDWARLLESIGSFSVRGYEMFHSPNGANLKINTSDSLIFNRAINLYNGPTLEYDRNVNSQAAVTACPFRIGTRSAATLTGSTVTDIDPTRYDLAGVATVIPNPSSNATIQRLYYSPLADDNDKFFIQYGQTVYTSLANAIAAIGSTNFEVNPLLKFTMLVGYIAVTKGATNLSDPAQATFRPAQRFAIR